jgi:octanoyl-[GcvH]:protein N-octanoyltransferase
MNARRAAGLDDSWAPSGAAIRDRRLQWELEAAIRAVSPMECLTGDCLDSAQGRIDGDYATLRQIVDAAPRLRIWTNSRCIVASRGQYAAARFAAAKRLSEAAGWPVAVRRSGGSAVVHRSGILNVSVVRLLAQETTHWMTAGYEGLLDILVNALGRMDVACDHGAVPGAHCDGRFSLRSGGRKLAGTAAYSGRAGPSRYAVFHASIAVSGSLEQDLEAIGRFERGLGLAGSYDPSAHVSLSELAVGAAHDVHSKRSIRHQ